MLPPSSLRPLYFPAILLLVITAVGGSQINDFKSRKLDETDESKCGGCPCSNPCTTPPNPPPPPPPTPCPPPPAPVEPPPSSGYCPPPPAPVKPPPSVYCPPPPPSPPSSSDIIYTTGPPGSLYPVDQTYSIAGDRSSVGALQAVVGGGLVALLMLW